MYNYIICIRMSLRLFSTFVKNIKNPICVNCMNFMEQKFINPYDEIYGNNNTTFGKCSKFGTQNLVTGDIEYDNALHCRKYDHKCGETGKYFIPKNNSVKFAAILFALFDRFIISLL